MSAGSNKKLTIEISSFPRSGNHWVRILSAVLLESWLGRDVPRPANPPKFVNNERAEWPWFSVPEINLELLVYKTHIVNLPDVGPDKIIYVYRHPLDVLLSIINFLRKRAYQIDRNQKYKDFFLRAEPKGVDEIYRDGDLDLYLKKFMEQTGEGVWPEFGKFSGYFYSTQYALDLNKTIPVKYEDLQRDAGKEMKRVWSRALGVDLAGVSFNPRQVDRLTIDYEKPDPKKGPIYWSGKSGVYRDYFSREAIQSFEREYEKELRDLGYL